MRYVHSTLAALSIGALLLVGTNMIASAESPAGSVQLVAVDSDTSGNSPNALGPTNVCAEVPVGQSRDIDLVVKGVPPLTDNAGGLAGYELRLYYDARFMKITAADVARQMLGANPDSSVIDAFTDPVPNDSGRFLVVGADFGADRGESGDGVLARLTVEGVSAGTTTLVLSPPGGFEDVEITRLNDSGNNEYVVENVQNAILAIGESCDPAATPPPAATPVTTAQPPGVTPEPDETDNPSQTGGPDDTGSSDQSPGGEETSGSPTKSPGAGTGDGDDGQASEDENDDGGSNALLFVLLGLGAAAIVAGIAFFVISRRRAGGEPPAGAGQPDQPSTGPTDSDTDAAPPQDAGAPDLPPPPHPPAPPPTGSPPAPDPATDQPADTP